jgi:hypothetical protein
MSNRIEQVLHGQEDNYLLPFLWQHGEDEAVIREEIARVHASGIRAICIEARPHPDFYGPTWWRDMDIIMDEARRRGLRVWLLDDDHFPTGHAIGKLVDAPAALRRLFLHERHVDAFGPQQSASFLAEPMVFENFQPAPLAGSRLVAAVAARRDETGLLSGELIDLTACVQDGVLYWDIPAGHWRVFFMTAAPTGGSPNQKDYINYIVPESVRVLVDAVYEPLYARYAADFGRTFAGFFSDEPGFYNDPTGYYSSGLGRPGVPLPWRPDLLEQLSAAFGRDFRPLLPLLFFDAGSDTFPARYTYMDLVSRLYAENFTDQLGDWCRAHGVEYIGHIIEDNNSHARLGCSAGHYFRSLWGQDMSGIDVVLWQLFPGIDQAPAANVSGEGDAEFYHYGLAKLGSSLAHIDPKKHDRAMCEIFGAFGWREGLKLMKWMTDFMLVRGINYFVPHAFSQAEFPDPDCPPHMYARGRNPQYRFYHILNAYTNRVSHLLSGGVHVASAAVLYHGEAEWSGAAMLFQKPMRVLMQSQIDADVLPVDVFIGSVGYPEAEVINGQLRVNQETYPALVIPTCEALPARMLERLLAFADQGLAVYFIDRLPSRTSDGPELCSVLERLIHHPSVTVLPLDALALVLQSRGFQDVQVDDFHSYLRSYHTRSAGLDAYLFVNEHPFEGLETSVTLPAAGPLLAYDALANRAWRLPGQAATGGQQFPLALGPYQSLFVLSGPDAQSVLSALAPSVDPSVPAPSHPALEITGPWTISTAKALDYPTFTPWQTPGALSDLSNPAALPTFSGTFRYECAFDGPPGPAPAVLDLGEVYETAEVWLNGEHVGARICPPYRFDLRGKVRPGANQLVIEVTNTLVKEQRDFLSRYAQQEPSGLLGPVRME